MKEYISPRGSDKEVLRTKEEKLIEKCKASISLSIKELYKEADDFIGGLEFCTGYKVNEEERYETLGRIFTKVFRELEKEINLVKPYEDRVNALMDKIFVLAAEESNIYYMFDDFYQRYKKLCKYDSEDIGYEFKNILLILEKEIELKLKEKN